MTTDTRNQLQPPKATPDHLQLAFNNRHSTTNNKQLPPTATTGDKHQQPTPNNRRGIKINISQNTADPLGSKTLGPNSDDWTVDRHSGTPYSNLFTQLPARTYIQQR
jgi:hypothetical protein